MKLTVIFFVGGLRRDITIWIDLKTRLRPSVEREKGVEAEVVSSFESLSLNRRLASLCPLSSNSN